MDQLHPQFHFGQNKSFIAMNAGKRLFEGRYMRFSLHYLNTICTGAIEVKQLMREQ